MPIVNNISNNPNGGGGSASQVVTHIPGHCTGLEITVNGENTADVTVNVKITDSEDVEWGGTKIVAKEGSLPEDENDGIVLIDNVIKNKYKETPTEELSLISQSEDTKTSDWYFTPFPYSTGLAVNKIKSGYVKKSISVIEVTPSFANASWAKIKELSDKGTASQVFNIGDTKSFIYDGQETSVYIDGISDKYNKIVCVFTDLLPNPENHPFLSDSINNYRVMSPHHQYMETAILPKIKEVLGFDPKPFYILPSNGSMMEYGKEQVNLSIPGKIYNTSNNGTNDYIIYDNVGVLNTNTRDNRKRLIGDSTGAYQNYMILSPTKNDRTEYEWGYVKGSEEQTTPRDSKYPNGYYKTSAVGDNENLYGIGLPYGVIFMV